MGIFKRKSKAEKFWDWFSKRSDIYFHFEKDQTKLFSELKFQLEKINHYIVFEFSSISPDGSRQFVISADGIKSIFPTVIALVEKAPIFQKWKIVAFRQPREAVTHLKYNDLIVNMDDVFFKYGKDNGKIALELYIRGFYESAEWTAITFILLDNVLGEYYAEEYLSSIDKKELIEEKVNELFPIRSLTKILNDYILEYNN